MFKVAFRDKMGLSLTRLTGLDGMAALMGLKAMGVSEVLG